MSNYILQIKNQEVLNIRDARLFTEQYVHRVKMVKMNAEREYNAVA